MAATPELAEQTVRDFVRRTKKIDDLALDTPLYADGVGLDSLETAELSATLEDALGTDPYSADEMPQTLGEIVAFYARTAA
ncbi:phosphopantetheine-binding protein [Jatrophihabitans fulvus]